MGSVGVNDLLLTRARRTESGARKYQLSDVVFAIHPGCRYTQRLDLLPSALLQAGASFRSNSCGSYRTELYDLDPARTRWPEWSETARANCPFGNEVIALGFHRWQQRYRERFLGRFAETGDTETR